MSLRFFPLQQVQLQVSADVGTSLCLMLLQCQKRKGGHRQSGDVASDKGRECLYNGSVFQWRQHRQPRGVNARSCCPLSHTRALYKNPSPALHTASRYHFSLDDLKGVGPSFCRAIAAAWCPSETSTHLPLHPAIRQALADPNNPVVAACRKDGPDFAYPPPPPAHGHNQHRVKPTSTAAKNSPLAKKGSNEDDAQSNSSESHESSEAVVVRVPPPRADINYTPVFALSLSLLQQASAAAAAMFKSTKQESSLIDCIPGFEIVRPPFGCSCLRVCID